MPEKRTYRGKKKGLHLITIETREREDGTIFMRSKKKRIRM